MALSLRQALLYTDRIDVYRWDETITDGKASGAWELELTDVPCHFTPATSQFDLIGGLLDEGDNVFTLDILHVASDVALRPADVVQVVFGNAARLNLYWRLRGDIQGHTRHARTGLWLCSKTPAPEGI